MGEARDDLRTWVLLLWLACSGWLVACAASHGPQDSTQTGNPPVIRSGQIALQVGSDEVDIVGGKGAVKPGGSAIEITNLATGKVTKAVANPDGSFDVQVDGSPNDAFSVKASSGGKSSTAVYVVRDGAAVGNGKDGSLSCDQRSQLAAQVLAQAVAEADTSCMVDADCLIATKAASCVDACLVYVSQAGQRAIEEAAAAIDSGLCANYAKSGCKHQVPSCTGLTAPGCVAGKCSAAVTTAALSCQQREQTFPDMFAAALLTADKQCMVDGDCVLIDLSSGCSHGCPSKVAISQAGAASVTAALAMIQDACSSFYQDGCQLTGPGHGCIAFPGPQFSAVCMANQCALGTAAPDAGAPDGADGGFAQADGDCLDQILSWGWNGGLAAYVNRRAISCVHDRVTCERGAKVSEKRCQVDALPWRFYAFVTGG